MQKTNMLAGTCKCGAKILINMEGHSKEEVIEVIKQWKEFSCPGHHVEMCCPYPRWWNLDEWTVEEGEQVSEEEFEAQLRAKYRDVRDATGMTGLITTFAAGFPMTNDGKNWDFTQSPKGKRWYYTND